MTSKKRKRLPNPVEQLAIEFKQTSNGSAALDLLKSDDWHSCMKSTLPILLSAIVDSEHAKVSGDTVWEALNVLDHLNPALIALGVRCLARSGQMERAEDIASKASGISKIRVYRGLLEGYALAGGCDQALVCFQSALELGAGQTEAALVLRTASSTTPQNHSLAAFVFEWMRNERPFLVIPQLRDAVVEYLDPHQYGFHGTDPVESLVLFNKEARVDKTSAECDKCGTKLLDKHRDVSVFMDQIEKEVVSQSERVSGWETFKSWLPTQVGYDIVVDAANVGYFNGGSRVGPGTPVDYHRIDSLVTQLELAGHRVLVIMHARHFSLEMLSRSSGSKQLVSSWKEWTGNKKLYIVDRGQNDDWYWMYAAFYWHATLNTCVITVDECRDHIFQILEPSEDFKVWKTLHVIKYNYAGDTPTLFYPLPFSRTPQSCPDSGAWHFPIDNSWEWLCVLPSSHPLCK